jgi:hypothetical protein
MNSLNETELGVTIIVNDYKTNLYRSKIRDLYSGGTYFEFRLSYRTL